MTLCDKLYGDGQVLVSLNEVWAVGCHVSVCNCSPQCTIMETGQANYLQTNNFF